ncbi:MAG: hypothetical protein CVT79_07740 [Alphaproteobacteria bacterium HGW-Alphaproteobacteria-18]|nr:MAG: hypothetical protein CVT79_07740 [Alphaproteobacteria bacterium HGW-Alphaproteobacteria-18]
MILRAFVSCGLAALMAACASAPSEAPPADPVVKLADEVFAPLLYDTYFKTKPPQKADEALGQLLTRADLTDAQKAETLQRRGFLRGLYIADWPQAYPQCAMRDYLAALELGPTEKVKGKIMEGLEYQVSRRIYFNQAPFLGVPEDCKPYVDQALAKLGPGH